MRAARFLIVIRINFEFRFTIIPTGWRVLVGKIMSSLCPTRNKVAWLNTRKYRCIFVTRFCIFSTTRWRRHRHATTQGTFVIKLKLHRYRIRKKGMCPLKMIAYVLLILGGRRSCASKKPAKWYNMEQKLKVLACFCWKSSRMGPNSQNVSVLRHESFPVSPNCNRSWVLHVLPIFANDSNETTLKVDYIGHI